MNWFFRLERSLIVDRMIDLFLFNQWDLEEEKISLKCIDQNSTTDEEIPDILLFFF